MCKKLSLRIPLPEEYLMNTTFRELDLVSLNRICLPRNETAVDVDRFMHYLPYMMTYRPDRREGNWEDTKFWY